MHYPLDIVIHLFKNLGDSWCHNFSQKLPHENSVCSYFAATVHDCFLTNLLSLHKFDLAQLISLDRP